MCREEYPSIEPKEGFSSSGERYSHPAFGVISLTTTVGGSPTLFGSDIGHNQRVTIRVNKATLDRNGSRDFIHGHQQLLELELSHAQFARFIMSSGQGDGVPCTLTWTAQDGSLPAIKKVETAYASAQRDIESTASAGLSKMATEVERLGALIESGKLGKKELRDVHRHLSIWLENLPKDMAYSVSRAQCALERATADAKIEVETYISMSAQRLGLNNLDGLGAASGIQLEVPPQAALEEPRGDGAPGPEA